MNLLKQLKKQSNPVLIGASDHYWHGWKNEWVGYLKEKLLKRFRIFDYFFVSGYLTEIYLVNRIGVDKSKIFQGLYSCDVETFSPIGQDRSYNVLNWPNSFIFVGTFNKTKGFDTLIEAYKKYYKKVDKPWKLKIVGSGDLEHLAKNVKGIENLGMKSNKEVSELLANSGVFVLPSNSDHWPISVHEAMVAGLPIIISDKCGNINELLQPFVNGYKFPSGDFEILANRFVDISTLASIMGENSYKMSYRFNPEIWVKTINHIIEAKI